MIAALFQLSDGTQAIGAGALRGLGDTRTTLVGNIIEHYGIGLGITVTAAYLVARFLAGTRG